MSDSSDHETLVAELVRERGGAELLSVVDLAIVNKLARALLDDSPPTTIAPLAALLPKPAAEAAPGAWSFERLSADDLRELERIAVKATGGDAGEVTDVQPAEPRPEVVRLAEVERELIEARTQIAVLHESLRVREATAASEAAAPAGVDRDPAEGVQPAASAEAQNVVPLPRPLSPAASPSCQPLLAPPTRPLWYGDGGQGVGVGFRRFDHPG